MKSFLIAILFLIIGALIGGFLAFGYGTGFGLATGFAAGACSALEAAKDQGLVTDAQYDQVLSSAAANLAGKGEFPPDAEIADTAAECDKLMAELRERASSQ